MTPTQRTGNFGARSTYRGREPASRLQPLFHQMGTMIQRATDDNRNYTVRIKITANITVEPEDAEIGEYIHPDHFQAHLGTQILRTPDIYMEKRVFKPTPQGYQRIK